MNSKSWITLIFVSVVVAVMVGLISMENGYDQNQALQLAGVAGLLAVILGLLTLKDQRDNYIHKVSKYAREGYDANGCNQTINIYQNCKDPQPGPGPKPEPIPIPEPVSVDAVRKWIDSVDNSLTESCKKCIIDNAVNIWTQSTLVEVQSKDIAEQKNILQALLAFNCSKQCVIAPAVLDRQMVEALVYSIEPNMSTSCAVCMVDSIMQMWTMDDYNRIKEMNQQEQINVLMLIRNINCSTCDVQAKVDPNVVERLISLILVGAKPNCYKCVVQAIVNMWSLQELDDFKKMDRKSQGQVVQAIIALNCKESCTYVPSGITDEEALAWVQSAMPEMNNWLPECVSCLVGVVKSWSRDNFRAVQDKSHEEQVAVITNLATVDCQNSCIGSPEPEPQPSPSYYEPCCGGR